MGRPPLANLFAVYEEDPAVLEGIILELQRGGEFAEVWRPAQGWVTAVAPLPGGEPAVRVTLSPSGRGKGEGVGAENILAGANGRSPLLAFAEGRDVLEGQSGKDHPQHFWYKGDPPGRPYRELVELVDSRPEGLSSLPGDFGFIRFRPDGGATVVRSCGGLVPFYLGRFGNRLAISTQLGHLVRYLPDEPGLDPLVNATWSTSWGLFPDGRTPLSGVSILGRGCFARIEGGRLGQGRYWNPRPRHLPYPTPGLAREHAERLRDILIGKLRRDLDPEGGNLLTLSGGVDSSSLAALAAGTLGLPVWTWSLLPSKGQEKALQHELSYIEPLARQYGFQRCWSAFTMDRLALDLYPLAPRIVFHVLHPALCSLPGLLREAPVRVLFGGEYADELCGSAYTVSDWADTTSLPGLLTDFQALLENPRNLGRWAKYRVASFLRRPVLPFPKGLLERDLIDGKPMGFFHPGVEEEYRSWYEGQRRQFLADSDPWRHLALNTTTMDCFVPMNWEACSALGIRRSFPFFNREVLELAFECHPSELYGPGPKKLLRAALKGDVPERNLFRPDKGMGRWASAVSRTRLQALRSWQEALPVKEVPGELVGVLRAEWFSNPPKELSYWQLRYLTRLLLFVECLRGRRQGRELRVKS